MNPETTKAILEADQLHRSFNIGDRTIQVLRGVSLRVDEGDTVFLIGASGAGKSTLLYTLAGLERPEKGTVRIDGQSVYGMNAKGQAQLRNRLIGFVFQGFHLLPELTALENVAMPLHIGGRDGRTHAMELLESVGLADRAHHLPLELSGGEQQRVAIARALANDPRILFADEPTGNLDSGNSAKILELLIQLTSAQGRTLVVVTHDAGLSRLGNRRLHLIGGHLEDAPIVD